LPLEVANGQIKANVRTPDMKFTWRNAHSSVNFTVSTSGRERESWRTPCFCTYAVLIHEAPGVYFGLF